MAALVEVADIAVRFPGGIADADTPRVQSMIEDASAVVQSYTRRSFGTSTQVTHRLRPTGDVLKLTQRPVISVESVSVVYNDTLIPTVSYVFDGYDEIWLLSGEATVINLAADVADLLAYHTPMCEVTYTYGYPQVPDDVKTVVCNMVLRAIYTPNAGALMSEQTGPYNYRLNMTRSSSGGGAPSPMGMFGVTADEREILNQYRKPASTIELR